MLSFCLLTALALGQSPTTLAQAAQLSEPVRPAWIVDAVEPGRTERCWLAGDYLLGCIRGGNVPPLVTAGTGPTNPGILGQPGTVVLFGDERVGDEARSGFRLAWGKWLDECRTCGIEARVFWLAPRGDAGTFTGSPTSRPFIDGNTGRPGVELVDLDGVIAGGASVDADSGPLLGVDLDCRKLLCCGCDYRVEWLTGYRFLYFKDSVEISENLVSEDPVTAGTTFRVNDRFEASNCFHGLNLGICATRWRNQWAADCTARLALGCVQREIVIDGSTVATPPGAPPLFSQGGLLALQSNIGRHDSAAFAIVPEFGVGLSCQLTQRLHTRVGYTLLLWPNVARAGDQIDLVVNPNLIPPPIGGGPSRPMVLEQSDLLWMHALSLRLELRY